MTIQTGRLDHNAAATEPVINRLDRDRLRPHLGDPVTVARARLRRLLERARVLEPRAIPPGIVTMRSVVLLRDPSNGMAELLRLCYPGDEDMDDEDAVLVTSPLGAMLLAARPGSAISYPGARIHRTLVLEAITFQPEEAGNWTL
ncbi:MAG: GreA/GreB family elongation factor [Phycisphaerales bacterium JB060]